MSAVGTEVWAFAVLSRLGFQQEVILLGVAVLAFVTYIGVQAGVILLDGAQHLP